MRTVYVRNLPFSATVEGIVEFFHDRGLFIFPRRVGLFKNKTGPFAGKHCGAGFVKFETDEDAARAVKEIDGALLMGRDIVVQFANREAFERSTWEDIRA